MLPPILEAYKPSSVYGFRIKSIDLGKNPFVVNGVQHHRYGATETLLDLNVSWSSDMDVRLVIAVPGPDVEVRVRDFKMRMTIRVTLGPLIPQWPCFANIVLSLVGQPDMDYDITAGKVPLDTVPGLGSFLESFIRHTLVSLLAYPKGITLPVVKGYKIDVGKAAGALGTLQVSFLRVDHFLPRFNKYKKTPFYVKVELVDSGMKRIRGESYTGLTSAMSDVVRYTLYDTTSSLRVWLYFDVVGTDVCVGLCDVPVHALMHQDPEEEMQLVLCKHSDPSRERRCSVFVRGAFLPFGSQSAPPCDAPPATPPPCELSPQFLQEAQRSGPPDPPTARHCSSTGNASREGPPANTGVLFVTVVSAANLRNRELMGKSDPYVFLRVGPSTRQSRYVKSSLNPTFNFEAELDVENIERDVLRLSIIDKNDGMRDKLMGELCMDISTIQSARNAQISGEFELAPQGTVTLTAHFLSH
ncbi:calcium-dependent lipid binding protein [Strigomonas culicis]|nr:calcium-dependent lipid binding protein [Strigomonas culicis]|eukprot:EPY25715.1 calcium-dependent lipid binding protein [Strigomonas culicis]